MYQEKTEKSTIVITLFSCQIEFKTGQNLETTQLSSFISELTPNINSSYYTNDESFIFPLEICHYVTFLCIFKIWHFETIFHLKTPQMPSLKVTALQNPQTLTVSSKIYFFNHSRSCNVFTAFVWFQDKTENSTIVITLFLSQAAFFLNSRHGTPT